MTKLRAIDSIGETRIDLEKLKFISLQIYDFIVDCNDDDPRLVNYERKRISPLANILIDYVFEVDNRLGKIEKELNK